MLTTVVNVLYVPSTSTLGALWKDTLLGGSRDSFFFSFIRFFRHALKDFEAFLKIKDNTFGLNAAYTTLHHFLCISLDKQQSIPGHILLLT